MRGLAVALVIGVVSCSPRENGPCVSEGEARCDGTARMLLCHERTWTAIACAGPGGCSTSDRFVDCDESIAVEGSSCGADAQGVAACSGDGSRLLECHDRSWVAIATCRGPAACTVTSNRRFADCDDSIAEPGDPCGAEETLSCSVSGRDVLRCDAHRFVLDHSCGSGRCNVQPSTVECIAG